MNLKIIVLNENGDDLYLRTLYREGNAHIAAEQIADLIEEEFGLPTPDEL